MVAQPKTFKFFSLRNYQADVVGQIFEAFGDRQRTLSQLATGSGKTAIGSAVADRFVKQSGRVLWLAHREELLTQAYEKLEEVCVAPVALIQSRKKIRPEGLIQVASVSTLARRKQPLEIDLIITDEAHHATSSTYQKVYEQYPDAYHLGLTATPKRLDGKGLDTIYDRLVCGASVSWLTEHKYLSAYRLFVAQHLIDTKGVRTMAGDFNPKQLHIAALSADVMAEIVPSWQEHALDRSTVVFCCDIDHSMAVCQLYRDAGVVAVHLDGDTPVGQRRQMLADFRAGKITVLTNCGIVSEGLDIPGIECVQILRPTQSIALYLQMVGRSLRPGKAAAYILDHTKNWQTHGLPDDDRTWSLDGTVKRIERKTALAPNRELVIEPERIIFHDVETKLIEVTREQLAPTAHESSVDMTKNYQSTDDRSGELLNAFTSAASPTPVLPSPFPWIDQLIQRQIMSGYKKGWVVYRVFDELKKRFDEFDFSTSEHTKSPHLDWLMAPLKYLAVKLNYSSIWAVQKYDELFKAFVEKIQQQQLFSSAFEEADNVVWNNNQVEGLQAKLSLIAQEHEQNIEAIVIDLNHEALSILSFLIKSLKCPAFHQLQEWAKLSFKAVTTPLGWGGEIVAVLHFNTLHVDCLKSRLYTCFLWMRSHRELIQSQLKIMFDLPKDCSMNFSFIISVDSSLSSFAKCPKCDTTDFRLLPASTPHCARLECVQGHFIQWISETKLVEQISIAHNFFDLPKVWKAMLAHLEPGATQVLIHQHCYLRSLTSQTAIVETRSEALTNFVRTRTTHLETAFEQALGHRVEVKICAPTITEK